MGERIRGLLLGKLNSWTEEGEGTRKLRKKEKKEGRNKTSIVARLKDQGLDPISYKR